MKEVHVHVAALFGLDLVDEEAARPVAHVRAASKRAASRAREKPSAQPKSGLRGLRPSHLAYAIRDYSAA